MQKNKNTCEHSSQRTYHTHTRTHIHGTRTQTKKRKKRTPYLTSLCVVKRQQCILAISAMHFTKPSLLLMAAAFTIHLLILLCLYTFILAENLTFFTEEIGVRCMRKDVRLKKNMLRQCAAMPQIFISGQSTGLYF